MDPLTLVNLVRLAQGGSRGAFDRLVREFEPEMLRAVARRLPGIDDAREVVQEALLLAYTKIAQLRSPERFPGWLRRIALRAVVNRIVRVRAELPLERDALGARRDTVPGPLETVLLRERASRVWEGLGRLGRQDRETLVAFYVRGRSLREMSRDFHSPLGTIKRRLHTARKRLRDELIDLQPA